MSQVIRQTESLNDIERRKLFGWGENIFGDTDRHLIWRSKDLHFLLYIDKKVVSHVGILEHRINVDGQTKKIGGVSGVITVADEQRKGYASLLMKHAARFLTYKWDVDFGLLFCLPRMISFYELLGWKTTKQRFLIEQPNGKIFSPLTVMVLPCKRYSLSEIDIDLQSRPW